MAPTYIANVVSFLFVGAQLLGVDIPYTPETVEQFLTLLFIVGTPIFTAIRQVWTGRATVLGAAGPAAKAS